MVRRLIIVICLSVITGGIAYADVELDVTGNDAIDIALGGTNATTEAGARSALGLSNAYSHTSADGSSHANVATNTTHSGGTGSDHSAVASNTSASHAESHTVASHSDNVDLTSDVTGVLPIANMATGTPDGTKYIRDDGTLVTPSGSGSAVSVVDESTELTADVTKLTFTGAGVVATEPGTADEITVTIDGGGSETPATTVTSETTFGISAVVGTDTEYSRQDHTHGSPTDPVTAHTAVTTSVHGITNTAVIATISASGTDNSMLCRNGTGTVTKDCTEANVGDITVASGGKIDAGAGELQLPNGAFASIPGSPADGDIYVINNATDTATCDGGGTAEAVCVYYGAAWAAISGGGAGGAPTDADYLVETANGSLSAEIAVGAYTDGLVGVASGTVTDIDTEAELETALGSVDVVTITASDITKANLETALSDVADIAEADGDTYTGTHNYGATTMTLPPLAANEIASTAIDTIVDTIVWNAGGMIASGTCTDAAEATINSGPIVTSVICTDALTSVIDGSVEMPDSWDGGTVVFKLSHLQTVAETLVFNSDIEVQARGAGETVNDTWSTPIAIDDGVITGSSGLDITASASITPNCTTSCQGGDTLYWKLTIHTDSTVTFASHHILSMAMEYTSNVGD